MAVYNVGDVDNVNPANGNLFLNIPLLSYPQRGNKLRLDFKIYYNDKAWFIGATGQESYAPNGSNLIGAWTWYPFTQSQVDDIGVYVARDQGFAFDADQYQTVSSGGSNQTQFTTTTTLYGYFIRSADGSKHYFADKQFQTCRELTTGCPGEVFDGYGNSYPSTDGSGYFPLSYGTATSSVLDSNGVKYAQLANGYNTVTDPSGNQISVNASGWTDTIGRVIPGAYTLPGSNGFPNSFYLPVGHTGDPIPGVAVSPGQTTCPTGTYQARQWTVPSVGSGATQTYYLCYNQFSFQTAFDLPTPYSVWDTVSESSGQAVLLSSIMLPNKTSYSFSYDQYLSLNSLTLPTGATITYTWQNVYFFGTPYSAISRALLTRTVNPGNGEPSRTWHYQFLPNAPNQNDAPQPLWSIVTDPEGNDVESQLGGATISAQNYYSGCGPHDTISNRACSGSGTLLKSVSYAFTQYQNVAADPGTPAGDSDRYGIYSPGEPTTTTTTWPLNGGASLVTQTVTTLTPMYGSCSVWLGFGGVSGGQVTQPTQQTRTPCLSMNEPQSVATYDYGSGAAGSLLNTKTTNYEWQLQSSSTYLNANLMNLPSSVVTTDGGGNKAAETDYYYDQSPSPSGAFGNLTSTVQWLNTGTSLTSQAAYNSQGMPTSTTDAKQNTTTIAYDTTYGVFPITVTHPPTNGISHIDHYVFDSNTGLTTSHTDWNGNATTYSYINSNTGQIDPLNRLGQITYPATTDGTTGNSGQGYKKYFYTDTPGSLAVTEQDFQSTNGTIVTHVNKVDDLGAVLHSLTTDPEGTDTVDTTYDLLGRVQSVSNPYRSISDPTYGITSYTYDALSRKRLQCQQDNTSSPTNVCTPGNSYLQWAYSGNTVTFTDETGRIWERTGDGLGRLTQVLEPNSSNSPTIETDYQYDALNNLLRVDQWGGAHGSSGDRVRTFTYDSLSRLLTSSNPEAGMTTYTYLTSGALCAGDTRLPCSKTNANNVTFNYAYDALNRLLSKNYTNDTAATPTACYQYDQSSQAGTSPNLNGRLANEWTQGSSVACPATLPSTGTMTSKLILAYDAMGLVLTQQTCVYPNCTTTSTPYPLTFSYDLAGNLTTYTNGNPSNPFKLINGYDSAGRLSYIHSTWSDSTHPSPLFSSRTYAAPGGLTSAVYGTGNAVTVTRTYDPRLRLTGETDAGSATQPATPGSATVTITGSEQTQ